MPTLPEIQVGEPIRHECLAVFPLFSPADGGVEYLLSDEAIRAGSVNVEEVSEGGSVPNLLVTNQSDSKVLFLEGEELRGAKQNRVLNTSVLVAAHSKTTIPVSCVEQGRWRYRSRQFVSGESHSSSKLRHHLKQSVSDSLKSGRGHTSDQMAVWGEVTRQMTSLGSSSETGAMADTYETYRERLDEFREQLAYVEGATGVAIAVGKQVVALDLFDKPSTCRKVWGRLLTGVVMDALEAKSIRSGCPASRCARLCSPSCGIPCGSKPQPSAKDRSSAPMPTRGPTLQRWFSVNRFSTAVSSWRTDRSGLPGPLRQVSKSNSVDRYKSICVPISTI